MIKDGFIRIKNNKVYARGLEMDINPNKSAIKQWKNEDSNHIISYGIDCESLEYNSTLKTYRYYCEGYIYEDNELIPFKDSATFTITNNEIYFK